MDENEIPDESIGESPTYNSNKMMRLDNAKSRKLFFSHKNVLFRTKTKNQSNPQTKITSKKPSISEKNIYDVKWEVEENNDQIVLKKKVPHSLMKKANDFKKANFPSTSSIINPIKNSRTMDDLTKPENKKDIKFYLERIAFSDDSSYIKLINGVDMDGNTPLHIAFKHFNSDVKMFSKISNALIEKGADPSI